MVSHCTLDKPLSIKDYSSYLMFHRTWLRLLVKVSFLQEGRQFCLRGEYLGRITEDAFHEALVSCAHAFKREGKFFREFLGSSFEYDAFFVQEAYSTCNYCRHECKD